MRGLGSEGYSFAYRKAVVVRAAGIAIGLDVYVVVVVLAAREALVVVLARPNDRVVGEASCLGIKGPREDDVSGKCHAPGATLDDPDAREDDDVATAGAAVAVGVVDAVLGRGMSTDV